MKSQQYIIVISSTFYAFSLFSTPTESG